MERMHLPVLELKADESTDDASAMTITGLGAAFGNVDSYGDVIEKGAFADFLDRLTKKRADTPAMLAQHGGWGITADDMQPIGKWESFEETDRGLKVSGKLVDTQRGLDTYKLLKAGAITGLSIGFRIAKAEAPGTSAPNGAVRIIKAIDLFEISVVTFPANGKARVQSVKASELTIRELERRLVRDAGFSRSECDALLRGGLTALKAERDAGGEGDATIAALVKSSTDALALRVLGDSFLARFKG